MKNKTYDIKTSDEGFLIWDRESREWIDLPQYCDYYSTINSEYYSGSYRDGAITKGNKTCKLKHGKNKYSAGLEYVKKKLNGKDGANDFWKFPSFKEKR